MALLLAFAPACLSGNVTADEARELVNDKHAVLVDVRTHGEFAVDHIDGAVNVPVSDIEASPAAVPVKKDQDVIVYCQSGHRSARAAAVLTKAGYTKVHDLGSILNWK
jgi:rhodanese-related sulfurtransferase